MYAGNITRYGLTAIAVVCCLAVSASGVTFVIDNLDEPDEGVNDPELGADRLAAITYAANVWGSLLPDAYEGETITIEVTMDPMGGSAVSAVLASASPIDFERNFTTSSLDFVASTWYGSALANHLHGADIDSSSAEISISFNSDVDNDTVLGDKDWYYGTDLQAGDDEDFVTVAMHEMGHGLNVMSMLRSDGGYILNGPGIYDRFLVDGSDAAVTGMTYTDRGFIIESEDLHWSGANGTLGNGGIKPKLYAPFFYEPGSSISHLDETAHENELMSPYYSGPDHTLSMMELGMLDDMGWGCFPEDGDINNDGTVGLSDLSLLAVNWGVTTDMVWENGDVTGDGAVDLSDLSVLGANWESGFTLETTGQVATVPEPATMLLMCAGALGLVRRRK